MQVNPATASLYIANPLERGGRGMAALFSTHPPIPVRIERLRAFDAASARIRLLQPSPAGPPARTAAPGGEHRGMAATQEALYGAARPRPLLVGGGAPGARADEARPPAAPVPRQVRPAARRGAARPLRRRRAGASLDPFAGSGTTLVQALESGYDATGVDIAGFNCLLMRVKTRRLQPRRAPPRPALGARRRQRRSSRTGALPAGTSRYVRDWFAPARRGGAAPLPLARRAGRVRGRAPGRARARRALGAPDDALRPRLPARAAARASTGATSTSAPAGPSRRRGGSCSGTRSTRSTGSRRSRRRARPDATRRSLHGDARELDLAGPFDASSRRRPTPG